MSKRADQEESARPVDGAAFPAVSAQQTGQQPGDEANRRPKRDWLDITDILLRPSAAFLTAVTVALIGWFGQQALEFRASEETKRASSLQSYQLYSQLLSNREESESSLRKDIFGSILKEFLAASGDDDGHEYIRNRLLKLEILALNFGDALSLSPLFLELDKNIRQTRYGTEFARLDKADDRKRLESLARRVAQQQLSALSTGGNDWDFEVLLSKVSDDQYAYYPRDEDKDMDGKPDGDDYYSKRLEEIDRNYEFRFSRADSEDHSVNVEIAIQKVNDNNKEGLVEWPVEQRFTLNFFNFPMVDNTRLSDDQRFALIMTGFGSRSIAFSAIVFPGKYSSQRDKPFIDDVIHRLRPFDQTSELTGALSGQ